MNTLVDSSTCNKHCPSWFMKYVQNESRLFKCAVIRCIQKDNCSMHASKIIEQNDQGPVSAYCGIRWIFNVETAWYISKCSWIEPSCIRITMKFLHAIFLQGWKLSIVIYDSIIRQYWNKQGKCRPLQYCVLLGSCLSNGRLYTSG